MAAEIRHDVRALACHGAASMRPRRMAAEILRQVFSKFDGSMLQ